MSKTKLEPQVQEPQYQIVSKRFVAQADLLEWQMLEDKAAPLREQLKKLEARQKPIEETCKELLQKGAKIEVGDMEAMIVDGAIRPAWKEEFIRVTSEAEAQAVMSRTPKSKSLKIRRKLKTVSVE